MAKICLDPGHSGSPDPGAIGTFYTESALAFAIAMGVRDKLRFTGHTVDCTKWEEKDPNSDEMFNRTQLANAGGCDLFVSIHLNGSENPEATGTETFYLKDSREGQLAAYCVQKRLVDALDLADRGLKTARYYVLVNTQMPAILVEVGFITNPEDEKLIADNLDKVCTAIASGILDYFG
jgi:N-acetylmuramoyl-L-alanine amidase